LARDPRKYLALQRDLGGNEVILSRPLGEPSVREEDPSPLSAPAVLPASPALAARKHWSADAPPIPAQAGIIIPPRQRDLIDQGREWKSLDDIARVVAGCARCFLSQGRKKTVPGEGNPKAQLMFVGEGPGQTEDETGRPFVGKAGELLTRMIEAIDLRREDVFILNTVKCRPPLNRKPLPDELAACAPYLERQIELVGPKVLVALGATAAESLLSAKRSLTDLRGRVHSFRGIPLVVTYHPAALLRNPNWKKPTWDDVRIARQLLDR